MMLKFVQIPSLEQLRSVIERSRGKVYLQLSDEIFVDMKQTDNALNELRNALHKSKSLKIHVFDTKDYLEFVNYMAGAAYDESAYV